MRPIGKWFAAGLFLMLALGCGERREEGAGQAATPAPPTTPQPARIVGEVRLAGQEDASGVQVYIPGGNLLAITGRDGRYALQGVGQGRHEVMARLEGYEPTLLGTVSVKPSNKEEQYTLEPVTLAHSAEAQNAPPRAEPKLGSIRGRLLHAAGDTVDWSGAQVELSQTPYRTTAAADGSFLLWNIPPDQYRLTARMDGYEPASANVRVLPAPAATTVTLDLTPSGPADGGAASGILTLRTYPPAGAGRPGGAAPATTATTARVVGVARKNLEGEAPVDMSGIQITLAGSSVAATTDQEGNYLLENVAPGRHELLAQAQGFEPARVEIEVAAGQEAQVEELLLEPIRQYPEVVETSPGDGARGVVVQRVMPLMIRFNKKMNMQSVRQALRFDPPVAFQMQGGKESPDTDFDLVKINVFGAIEQPVAKFRTRYTLTIGQEATDLEGLRLQEPFQMSFTTGEASVVMTDPPSGAREVGMAPHTPVVFHFNAPMEYRSLSSDSIRITPALETAPFFSLSDDPDTGWTRLIITGIWKPDTEYRVTLSRRARTVANNTVSNTPYILRFKTAKLTLRRLPTVPRTAR